MIALTFIALLLITQPTLAGTTGGVAYKTEFYINSGVSFPIGPDEFSDYWRMGYNFGGGMGIPVSSNIILIGYFQYNSFRFDDDEFLQDWGLTGYGISISGGEASIMTISGTIKATLGQTPLPMRPYLCGGVGFFKLSIGDITVYDGYSSETAEGDSENAFSILFGAGVDFTIGGRIGLFIEGQYVIGYTEGESTQIFPLKVGIRL